MGTSGKSAGAIEREIESEWDRDREREDGND